ARVSAAMVPAAAGLALTAVGSAPGLALGREPVVPGTAAPVAGRRGGGRGGGGGGGAGGGAPAGAGAGARGGGGRAGGGGAAGGGGGGGGGRAGGGSRLAGGGWLRWGLCHGADLKQRVRREIARRIDAGLQPLVAAIGGNQGSIGGDIDLQHLAADLDALAHVEMQMIGRAARAVHILGDATQHIALLDLVALLHLDRVGMHVEVFEDGAIVALELDRRVRGHERDDAVGHRHHVPGVVLAAWWANVLTLMTLAAGTQRHAPAAHLAEVVALVHGVVVARIAFG